MKKLTQLIDKLAASSTVIDGPKAVIEDLACLAFNTITDGRLVAVSGLFHMDSAGQAYALELSQYRQDPAAWAALQAVYMEYLSTVKGSEPFADVLGPLYDAYLGKRHGQFLTPPHLAQALAGLVPIAGRMTDNTCGAGSLLLGGLRHVLAQHGAEGVSSLILHASDIDPMMCRMAAVQLTFGAWVHGLPFQRLTVHCMDTITRQDNGRALVLDLARTVTGVQYQ